MPIPAARVDWLRARRGELRELVEALLGLVADDECGTATSSYPGRSYPHLLIAQTYRRFLASCGALLSTQSAAAETEPAGGPNQPVAPELLVRLAAPHAACV